jgi:hypothetical protein
MATEISNGKQTVKLYHSVNRGKAMYQLAYYAGGRRVQKNFSDKAEAERVARAVLGGLAEDAVAVDALATPELESLIAARKVLATNYALHVAVPADRLHILAVIYFPQYADDFFRRVSLLLHVRFLAFQVGTSHSIRSTFRGLDQHSEENLRLEVADRTRYF